MATALKCTIFRKSFFSPVIFKRTAYTPPSSLYPYKEYRWKKFKADRQEVVEDLPLTSKTWSDIKGSVVTDETLDLEDINIGEDWVGLDAKWRSKLMQKRSDSLKELKNNTELHLAARMGKYEIAFDKIHDAYRMENQPLDTFTAAKHYGLFRDLFQNAFFVPVTELNIFFDINEDDLVMPVCRGNHIYPSHAENAPDVIIDAEEKSLYTLVLTNLDGHFTSNNSEYLHWMISNIRDGDIKTGSALCDYLRPFPAKGTGWHRYVFLLFKQSKDMQYPDIKCSSESVCLQERTFHTQEFYEKYQDSLTPVGLAFFQTEWESCVKETFHHVLNMREPSFEYAFQPEYLPPQELYPAGEPFDRYMDKYRHKKDLAEEAIVERMRITSPFKPVPKEDFYEAAYAPPTKAKPTWLQTKHDLRRRRVEYFADINP